MKRMKQLALLLAVLSVMTLFAACNPSEQPGGDTQTAATTANTANTQTTAAQTTKATEAPPVTPVRTDLRLATTADVSTLDPMFTHTGVDSSIKLNLYESLVEKVYEYDAAGNTVNHYAGRLAESWEFSDDFLQVTFKLKKGVKFHNGDELKASDVLFSFNRAVESPYFMSKMENFVSAEATDDYTVVVTLGAVTPTYLENMLAVSMVSEKYVTEIGDDAFAEKPMGTGPYILSNYVPMQSFEFTAFEDYHRGAARIKTINIDILPDATSAMMAFEAGNFDLTSVPSESVDRIKSVGTWKTYETTGVHPMFLQLNFENEYLGNVKLRQALHYAINKASQVALARDTHGVEAYAFFNPELMVNTCDPDTIYTYDLEKARALLTEAGFPNGEGLPQFTIKVIAGAYEKAALVLQQDFTDLGLDIKVEVLEANTWGQDVTLGNYEMSINGASVSDLVYPWWLLFHSQFLDAANFARNIDPAIDSLFEQLGTTMDEVQQQGIIKDIINYVNDNVVYIPLSYSIGTTALDPSLNFDVHPRSLTNYDFYWTE